MKTTNACPTYQTNLRHGRAEPPNHQPGGLMSGNDYFTGFVPAAQLFFGVKDAVDEFFAAVPARVYATVSYDPASDIAPDWYVLKC